MSFCDVMVTGIPLLVGVLFGRLAWYRIGEEETLRADRVALAKQG